MRAVAPKNQPERKLQFTASPATTFVRRGPLGSLTGEFFQAKPKAIISASPDSRKRIVEFIEKISDLKNCAPIERQRAARSAALTHPGTPFSSTFAPLRAYRTTATVFCRRL